MTEHWQTISEAPRYKISNMGNIYSLVNNIPKLSFIDKKGYKRVQLYRVGDKPITCKVHRLVAKYFLLNPINLPQVNHKDGNKSNNVVDNLEWVTQSQNMRHSVVNSLHLKRGDLVELLPQIKQAIDEGYVISDIAKNYSTSSKTIKSLISRFPVNGTTITTLRVGRKNKYIYFDNSRSRWRTDIRWIKNRQFRTEHEAVEFVNYYNGKGGISNEQN